MILSPPCFLFTVLLILFVFTTNSSPTSLNCLRDLKHIIKKQKQKIHITTLLEISVKALCPIPTWADCSLLSTQFHPGICLHYGLVESLRLSVELYSCFPFPMSCLFYWKKPVNSFLRKGGLGGNTFKVFKTFQNTASTVKVTSTTNF